MPECKAKKRMSKREEIPIFNPHNIPDLPQLTCKTALMVYIKSIGRGVPKHGAEVYSMSDNDFMEYARHYSSRSTRVRADGKRLGLWRGKLSSHMSPGNKCLGFLTSGGASFTHGNRIGFGLCAADKLYKAFRYAAIHVPSIDVIRSNVSNRDVENMLTLVLFKNPNSRQLRVGSLIVVRSPTI